MDTSLPRDPEPARDGVTAPPATASASDNAGDLTQPLNRLPWSAPWHWLALGWRDFTRAPTIGLFYGAAFVLMGWAQLLSFQRAPAYTLALSAGFLLVGPFLCLGLYHTSRALERGERPSLRASLFAWRSQSGTLAIFGFVLLVLEMLWARSSLVVFALSFDGMPDFRGSVLALLVPGNLNFIVAYLLVSVVFAGLIFAISVVSMPMILDRSTDGITAGLTSLHLVLTQPGVMLLWGALLTLMVVLAMLPGFAGLLVLGPVAGHASWHAYRQAVGSAEPTSANGA